MGKTTRSNNAGSSQETNTVDFSVELQRLEKDMKGNVRELKNLIMSNTNSDTSSENPKDKSMKNILEKISAFEINTQNSIDNLRSEIAKLRHQSEMCEKRMDDQKQVELLNGLVISGIAEEPETNNLCEFVADVINNKMPNISITAIDINYCFRLGKKENRKSTRPRPLSIMFVNRWMRNKVFNAKKCLKGTPVVINEWLTSARMEIYKKTCEKVGFKSTWTRNGQIYAIMSGQKRKINSENDLKT